MDISTITDVQALKAMAYDNIAVQDRAVNNLRAINQRITELSNVQPHQDIQEEKLVDES